MSENELDPQQIEAKVIELGRSMDRVKAAQADRDDVVVEMKQAVRTRLELLAKDLQPVFKEIPQDVDWFEFGLAHGEPPRLWIDITTHVRMGRDRRLYELVKDTRLGRTILFQHEDREKMAETVADYVAERLIERERAMEGEWVSLKNHQFDRQTPDEQDDASTSPTEEKRKGGSGLFWFTVGLLCTAAALFGWAWFGEIPQFLDQ